MFDEQLSLNQTLAPSDVTSAFIRQNEVKTADRSLIDPHQISHQTAVHADYFLVML